jgi:lipid A disaccharide synthetase
MSDSEKLKKFKVDMLLRLNSTITSMMGIDSTKGEEAFAKKLRKSNLKMIKEIDPEIFDMIDDKEN